MFKTTVGQSKTKTTSLTCARNRQAFSLISKTFSIPRTGNSQSESLRSASHTGMKSRRRTSFSVCASSSRWKSSISSCRVQTKSRTELDRGAGSLVSPVRHPPGISSNTHKSRRAFPLRKGNNGPLYRFFPEREEEKQFDELEGMRTQDYDLTCHTKGGRNHV